MWCVPIDARNMISLLRYLFDKQAGMAALSGALLREQGNGTGRSSGMKAMPVGRGRMPRNMERGSCALNGATDDRTSRCGGMVAMPQGLALKPEDREAMSQHMAGMARGDLSRSAVVIGKLRDLVYKLHVFAARSWHRTIDKEARRRRRLQKQAEFDALFVIEYTRDVRYEDLQWLPDQVPEGHPWLCFLEPEWPVHRASRRLLAVLLAFAHRVLRRTAKRRRWTFLVRAALPTLDLCGPLSPRPPPCAFV